MKKTFEFFNNGDLIMYDKQSYLDTSTLANANALLAQPIVYDTVADLSFEQNKIMKSGIIARSPEMQRIIQGEGMMATSRFMHDLEDVREQRGTENPDDRIKSTGVKRGKENVIKLQLNTAFSNMAFTSFKTNLDIMDYVTSRVPDYWARESQKNFVDFMVGVFASNSAGNYAGQANYADYEKGDLTLDVSKRAGGAFDADTTDLSASVIIEAESMKLDNLSALDTIVMHSNVYHKLRRKQALITIPEAGNPYLAGFEYYNGLKIVVDNNLPADPLTGIYETWLFGNNSVGFEQAPYGVEPTFEIVRDPSAGNGSVLQQLIARRVLCVHPIGHSYVNAENDNPDASAIRSSTSFARSLEDPRKIPYMRIITLEHAPTPNPI